MAEKQTWNTKRGTKGERLFSYDDETRMMKNRQKGRKGVDKKSLSPVPRDSSSTTRLSFFANLTVISWESGSVCHGERRGEERSERLASNGG